MPRNLSLDDLMSTLIVEMERDKYNEGVSQIIEHMTCLAKMSNLRELDKVYQSLREYIKQHKTFIHELKSNTEGDTSGTTA